MSGFIDKPFPVWSREFFINLNLIVRQERRERMKSELAAVVIMAALALVSGWLLWGWDEGFTGKVPRPATVSETTFLPDQAEKIREQEVERVLPTAAQEQKIPREEAESETQVLLLVRSGTGSETYEVPLSSSVTVADLMRRAAVEEGLAMEFDDYGGSMGLLITALNGLTNGDKPNHYWYFYVNGTLAEVGVSTFWIKPGDAVEWRFEEEKGA